MDAPVDGLREWALAALGAVALTAERAEALAEALSERSGISRQEASALLEELVSRWRGETTRVGEWASASVQTRLHDLGAVGRDEFEELELRLAQLEHRLKLLEVRPRAVPPA